MGRHDRRLQGFGECGLGLREHCLMPAVGGGSVGRHQSLGLCV